MLKTVRLLASTLATLIAALGSAQSSLLKVELNTRDRNFTAQSDSAYKGFTNRIERLTSRTRAFQSAQGRIAPNSAFVFPGIVRFTSNGSVLPTPRTRGNELTLDIDASFNTATHPNRVAFLQSVYNTAKPTIEAVFGDAAIAGTVKVVNVDAGGTVDDRRIIVGGYYLPNNGSGQREIRLGDYAADETMAVSLIHAILLAYLPDPAYKYDAYLEGMVRAATQQIVRIPAALPSSLSQVTIEGTLDNSYEIGEFYDWTNQRALACTQFIAPNLLNLPIQDGTLGGIFLARYKMSGTVWQKVLAEYPSAIKDMNTALRADPTKGSTVAGLESLFTGAVTGSIENTTPLQWLRSQFILQTKDTPGVKVLNQVFPIITDLSGTDFGVFGVELTAFRSEPNGNESLLSGTSYPIFWDEQFNRLNAGQSDQIDIAGSYGSVVPNFPNKGTNVPYRVGIDIPFQDRIVRMFVPAGAIATPANPTPSDFYGTYGGKLVAGQNLFVRASFGATTLPDIPIRDGAFGTVVGTATFLSPRSLLVQVIRKDTAGAETVLSTRRVNKGKGAIGVQLGGPTVAPITFSSPIPAGVSMFGLTGDPFDSNPLSALNLSSSLLARYNPSRTSYDLYPNTGATQGGFGYFTRLAASFTPTYLGAIERNLPLTIALRPGWNQITIPSDYSVAVSSLQVIRAKDFAVPFASASSIIANTIFQFEPGAADAVTLLPEGGTYNAATNLVGGRGYFVRCLSPEGAVLVVTPPSGESQGKTLPRPIRETTIKLMLDGRNESSLAFIGMAVGATAGFDPHLDTSLPPSVGGVQIKVLNKEERYSDYRGYRSLETFQLRFDGLIQGQTYSFRYKYMKGGATITTIKNLANGNEVGSGYPSDGFTFKATSASMRFDMTLRGAR